MTFQTYNLNLPNPPDDPAVDVSGMQTNTNSISGLLLQDHFAFNDNAGGNHKQVHLKNESAPGGLGANADGVFYANLAIGQSWPFWQNALGSFQMITPFTASANGSATLPGGLIIKWGTGTINKNGTPTAFFFSTAFPANLFSIVLGFINDQGNSPSANSAFIKSGTPSLVGFTVTNSSSSTTQAIYYIAIGN